jgi:hypothetical protein
LDVESVAGHLLPQGGVFAFLAAHRRELFPDEMFADLCTSGRGRPSIPADVIAAAIVLQTLNGLSDEVTGRVDLVDRPSTRSFTEGTTRRTALASRFPRVGKAWCERFGSRLSVQSPGWSGRS